MLTRVVTTTRIARHHGAIGAAVLRPLAITPLPLSSMGMNRMALPVAHHRSLSRQPEKNETKENHDLPPTPSAGWNKFMSWVRWTRVGGDKESSVSTPNAIIIYDEPTFTGRMIQLGVLGVLVPIMIYAGIRDYRDAQRLEAEKAAASSSSSSSSNTSEMKVDLPATTTTTAATPTPAPAPARRGADPAKPKRKLLPHEEEQLRRVQEFNRDPVRLRRMAYIDGITATALLVALPLGTRRFISRLTILPGRRLEITTYGTLFSTQRRVVSLEQVIPPAAATGNQYASYYMLRVVNNNGVGSQSYIWDYNPREPRTQPNELAHLNNFIKYNRPAGAK